ncbi:MAG: hypothetical protein A3I26_00445 [Candidatus Yanofskybacteria bacterium RIFCSPLOWO2_02_FULL_43_10]|nr:MAG: hypothetical protein A2742_00205 [Candidatus Yanofskybacteria bacterium RIFCSPHIGHO2_01_FULL_43_32]OGN10986.1 MAG: hypothetical protein A3C69_03345 [Candidatus Yanofskybacteria bacterium RIFCSPHIGHO2_02_FULL_43_12]OGN17131.1 MAG: hypothetical protein A3E34_03660 [Candidatus Yanofskybacteria bacterium RIFCSPHIGHO2_12_FULL_43_11]OGN24113.1 MAG: hypothetical protein A2923_02145 [Candidatus Yanofskybacteria bacterium RIFCSPLOWO2_01_FULL_43_46]OGN30570.1 MAG: hypothetical protein A3I26_00445
MRFEVVKTIYKAACSDSKVVFLTGDLGHAHLDDFRKNLPGQYYNIGIAEQNMIGIAAGLALSGHRVFVYSIAPFVTLRCLEQIKVDVCYQNVGVVVVGVAAGYAYSTCGCTHHAIEDVAAMKALPNMQIYSPSNSLEARLVTEYLIKTSHPAYLRIGKGGELSAEKEYGLEIGKGLVVKPGNDITIFATGTIVNEAVAASNILEQHGVSAEVINIHTIKPLDKELVEKSAQTRDAVFVLEEHNIIGGLGESIARIICECNGNKKPIFKCLGVPDEYNHRAGSHQYMLGCYGLNAEAIARQIVELYKKA